MDKNELINSMTSIIATAIVMCFAFASCTVCTIDNNKREIQNHTYQEQMESENSK